jgi:hypothetical protein
MSLMLPFAGPGPRNGIGSPTGKPTPIGRPRPGSARPGGVSKRPWRPIMSGAFERPPGHGRHRECTCRAFGSGIIPLCRAASSSPSETGPRETDCPVPRVFIGQAPQLLGSGNNPKKYLIVITGEDPLDPMRTVRRTVTRMRVLPLGWVSAARGGCAGRPGRQAEGGVQGASPYDRDDRKNGSSRGTGHPRIVVILTNHEDNLGPGPADSRCPASRGMGVAEGQRQPYSPTSASFTTILARRTPSSVKE